MKPEIKVVTFENFEDWVRGIVGDEDAGKFFTECEKRAARIFGLQKPEDPADWWKN